MPASPVPDSTQGWQRWALAYTSGVTRPANQRPEFALDYGNVINEGNTNLWAARDLAGRKYIKTGIAVRGTPPRSWVSRRS
jgi:hypothetical protein